MYQLQRPRAAHSLRLDQLNKRGIQFASYILIDYWNTESHWNDSGSDHLVSIELQVKIFVWVQRMLPGLQNELILDIIPSEKLFKVGGFIPPEKLPQSKTIFKGGFIFESIIPLTLALLFYYEIGLNLLLLYT